jgi:hypothetical protein
LARLGSGQAPFCVSSACTTYPSIQPPPLTPNPNPSSLFNRPTAPPPHDTLGSIWMAKSIGPNHPFFYLLSDSFHFSFLTPCTGQGRLIDYTQHMQPRRFISSPLFLKKDNTIGHSSTRQLLSFFFAKCGFRSRCLARPPPPLIYKQNARQIIYENWPKAQMDM